MKRRNFTALIMATCACFGWANVQAASWPEKTVKLIVPFPPGGSTDLIGRMLADGLAKQYPETSVVVENVPGGATVPSVISVMRGGENGNQILLSAETSLFINKYSFKKPPYNPDQDLAGVTFLYRTPHSLSVGAKSKYKTFNDFVADIKNNPGKITVAINVIGGSAHLSLERWKKANNLDFQIAPYKGGVQAISDVIGGHIDAHVDVLGNSYPFAKDGKIRPLAVLQNTRLPEFPDVVPQDENNPQDLTVPSILILTVHGKTPGSTIEKIYESVKKVTENPEFIARMKGLHFELVTADPQKTKKYREITTVKFKEMFTASGLPQN